MTKSKILIYSLVILSLVSSTGCFAIDKNQAEIKGKFVFDSNRFQLSDIFIVENGKERLLFKKTYNPAWSTDGKMIACSYYNEGSKKHGILILDSKGNKKDFVEMPAGLAASYNYNWSPDDTRIYYVPYALDESGNLNKVYRYDFLSKTHTKIIEIDKIFHILPLRLSPKGDKLLISYLSANIKERGTYLVNSDGTGLREIGEYRGDGPWYPDNEHVLYVTNMSEDHVKYTEDGHGYFFKMNVKTGEVEKLFPCNMMVLNLKMSRDGRYFYYVSGVPEGGRAVFVSPIDNPDKRIQITHPTIIPPPNYGRSQDGSPDWYQE